MPKTKKNAIEPIKQLMVELPLSEYQILEQYCQQRQETKRAIIRAYIRRLQFRLASN